VTQFERERCVSGRASIIQSDLVARGNSVRQPKSNLVSPRLLEVSRLNLLEEIPSLEQCRDRVEICRSPRERPRLVTRRILVELSAEQPNAHRF